MTVGSAHHTRRADDARAGGGGGGKGTLEVAVLTTSLLVASMTVTEVTSRMSLVGVVAVLGLLLLARGAKPRRKSMAAQPTRVLRLEPLPVRRGRAKPPLHLLPLLVVAGAAGVGLGVGFSLLFLLTLQATGQGAG